MTTAKLKTTFTLVFFSLILSGYKPPTPVYTAIVEGVVISEKNNKPVPNAHVFIIDGEEEALTNTKGEFRIETSQKFPLLLTVQQPDHEKTRLTLSAPARKLVVTLKLKK